MRKLFTVAFLTISYIQLYAFNILQATTMGNVPPPPTPQGGGHSIAPHAGGDIGEPDTVPINFIVPFLIIAAIALTFYILRKNKVKII